MTYFWNLYVKEHILNHENRLGTFECAAGTSLADIKCWHLCVEHDVWTVFLAHGNLATSGKFAINFL